MDLLFKGHRIEEERSTELSKYSSIRNTLTLLQEIE
jgi:hypothetical protein